MIIYLRLMYEFFKIGLFSFGGGYATIPFLYNISETHGWYTIKELTQIIAVASITPGPVGINAATYTGYKTAGLLGAVSATLFEILPSLIIVIAVAKILKNFSENRWVKYIIETLKPVSCALLVSVAIGLLRLEIINLKSVILLAVLLLISYKSTKEPVIYILIAGLIGFVTCFLSHNQF